MRVEAAGGKEAGRGWCASRSAHQIPPNGITNMKGANPSASSQSLTRHGVKLPVVELELALEGGGTEAGFRAARPGHVRSAGDALADLREREDKWKGEVVVCVN